MRGDVISHSFNKITANQETQRPGEEDILTLENNALSDSESDSVSGDSMNVMINNAKRNWRTGNEKL